MIRQTGRKAGKPAGQSRDSGGYMVTSMRTLRGEAVLLRIHTVKFCLIHGFVPDEVDHINRDPSDNTGSNLRAATSTQNKGNRRPRKRDLPEGVTQHRAKYSARFRNRYLGSFATVEMAQAVYLEVRQHFYGAFDAKS